MFWGLASGKVRSEHSFEHILRDIQTLNEWAKEGRLESSAVSVHAFSHVCDKYALLRHGGSFGEGYGPMVVAKRPIAAEELPGIRIAVPGRLTSAFLQLNLWFFDQFGLEPRPQHEVVPFDQIIPALQDGKFEAGLIIHEGQLTYEQEGLVEIINMGKWWKERTGLPLPLGVNVVRKDLGPELCREVSRCMRESIEAGLSNRKEALAYALQFARGLDESTSDEFVGMYVNDRTRDMGPDGIAAIRRMLSEAAEIGLVPKVDVEVID